MDPASAPENPNTLRVGKEKIEAITPPYLLMHIGTRVAPADAAANGGIGWDVSASGISRGDGKVSFDAAARQVNKSGGRILMTFKSAAGKSPNAHPNLTPMSFLFSSLGTISIGAAPKETPVTKYDADRLQHFEMTLDLDRSVWSLKIDDAEVIKEASLADYLKTGGDGPFIINQLSFTSEAGWGALPDATFILKNVKAIQVTAPTAKK